MATTRRRQSSTLIPRLKETGGEFEFFQAVRLLERAGKFKSVTEPVNFEAIADGAPAHKEAIRFRARHQLIFHASDIHKIDEEDVAINKNQEENKRWSMEVNFLSLAGSQGVLPHHISEIIQQHVRKKDHALKDYLDIFNHRTISLFYKAWHKHQMPITVERATLYNKQTDIFTDILCSIAGLTPRQMLLSGNEHFSIAGIAGLLSRGIASAESLSKIIKHQLGLAVTIEEFIGQWLPIDPRIQSQLPSTQKPEGLNIQLGTNVVIGENSWQLQNKFEVKVELLDYDDYMTLTPGSPRLKQLQSLIKFSTGVEQECDIVISINSEIIPPTKLENSDIYQPVLGWNSYLIDDTKCNQSIKVIISA